MLAWCALASTVLPLAFVWTKTFVLVSALVASAALAIGLAIAHRIRTRPNGWVTADARAIVRSSARKREELARFDAPFGVTLLASQARGRALLAVTTPSATRFVGVRLEGAAAQVLLEDASIVADGDALAAHAADAESMSADDALALLRFVRGRAPLAHQRLFLSGTHGERIVLDGPELRVEAGERSRFFDLESPVEWRGFLFHEALGPAASIFQATWVRQGSSELVFVAPMPTELVTPPKRPAGAPARRGLPDAQVLAPSPDEPPPGHLRTGIERVFMLPVREALARAPRPSRAPRRQTSTPDLGA
jgi:hypothetical protein